jgi:hypothetical protein
MLPNAGFVDTLQRFGPRIYSTNTSDSIANQFAAMPSLHFAWAVVVAWAVIKFASSRWRYLAILHPVLTLMAIVLTANHYWADAAVGLVLVPIGILGDRYLPHWQRKRKIPRPETVDIDLTTAHST